MQLTIKDLERGLKNKLHEKQKVKKRLEEYESACKIKHEIEREAGFFDKRGNIFEGEMKESPIVCDICWKRGQIQKDCPDCKGKGFLNL